MDVGERSLDDYRGEAADAILEGVRAQAEQLRGARVLHLNATPYGDEAFFQVTKAIHNGLQGSLRDLTVEQQRTYLAHAKENAAQLTEEYDFIFIHDPQPAALLSLHGKGSASWI